MRCRLSAKCCSRIERTRVYAPPARRSVVIRILLIAALVAGCKVNDYCIDCLKSDGGGSGDDGGGDDGNGSSDAGPDATICVPTGAEECDGKDNDCNGLIDEGTLPGVGAACSNQMGECAGGVIQCINGALKCNKQPSPEVCDTKDNNCNGQTDEGNPGGGAKCGTDQGECVAGTTT